MLCWRYDTCHVRRLTLLRSIPILPPNLPPHTSPWPLRHGHFALDFVEPPKSFPSPPLSTLFPCVPLPGPSGTCALPWTLLHLHTSFPLHAYPWPHRYGRFALDLVGVMPFIALLSVLHSSDDTDPNTQQTINLVILILSLVRLLRLGRLVSISKVKKGRHGSGGAWPSCPFRSLNGRVCCCAHAAKITVAFPPPQMVYMGAICHGGLPAPILV